MEASTPAKRVDVGQVIGETFDVYRQNLAALIISAAVVFVVVGAISGILNEIGGVVLAIIALIVRMAGQALYTGFVVRLVEDVRDGRRDVSVDELFAAAAPAIVPLALMSILWGLGVGIGFVLLVIPGLFLLTIWSVTAPAIVIERAGVLESFGRSRDLVRGDGWSVFATLLVVWLINVAVVAVLAGIGAAIGSAGTVVGVIVASAITAPILSLAVSVIFFNLRGDMKPPPAAPEPPPAQSPAT